MADIDTAGRNTRNTFDFIAHSIYSIIVLDALDDKVSLDRFQSLLADVTVTLISLALQLLAHLALLEVLGSVMPIYLIGVIYPFMIPLCLRVVSSVIY